MNNKEEHRDVLKSTGIFGGVQVIVILSGLAKAKIAAILIGPVGVGISSIYNNILLMLTSIIGLGIGSSAIREIAKESNDIEKSRVAKIAINLVLCCSIIGLIVTLILSYPLSEIMFGNNEYTVGFCIISISVFFTILSTGYNACLKGFRMTKSIAFVSLYSSIGHVLISFILFILWGVKAIPYTIAINALGVFALNYYYTKGVVDTSHVDMTIRQTLKEGKPMAILGIMLVLSSLIDYFVINATNAVIRDRGSLAEIGLYQGAMQITAMSINMVFAAIANDYYPRLSEATNDSEKFNNTMNTQAIIALLLMVPILNLMIVASPLLIQLFLSNEFSSISDFIYWILFGSIFMSVSWCLYFVPLAHGHTKRFLYMVIISAILKLSIQLPFYLFWGLKGIAIGNTITTFGYAFFAYILYRRIYKISFHSNFIQNFIILLILSSTVLITEIFRHEYSNLIFLEIALAAIGCLYSGIQLNKYTSLIDIIKNKIKR